MFITSCVPMHIKRQLSFSGEHVAKDNHPNQGHDNSLACILYPLKWLISFSFNQITGN